MLATAVLSFFSGRAQSMANKHDEAVAKKENTEIGFGEKDLGKRQVI